MVAPNRINPLDGIGEAMNPMSDPIAALQEAGCDFEVEKVPLYASRYDRGDTLEPVAGQWGIRRNDTGEVIGVAQDQYTPIQNRHFFGDIAGGVIENSDARITRCGSYDNGAKVFMNLEWPTSGDVKIVGDIVRKRCTIFTSHDAQASARTLLQPMRLVCLNGMVVPVPGASFDLPIYHTKSAAGRIAEAIKIVRDAGRYFDVFAANATVLAETKIGPRVAKRLIARICDPKGGAEKRDNGVENAAYRMIGRVTELFEGAQSAGRHRAVAGTAYGLYQAVIEDYDYASTIRKAKGVDEGTQRFKAAMQGGTAAKAKLQAWTTIVDELNLSEKLKRASN